MSNPIFENEYYTVTVGDFTSPVRSNGCEFTRGYLVTNKETGVVEFQIPQMPESFAAAEQLSIAMEERPWEWVRKQKEPPKVNPDGSSPEEVH
jgi:hypothetical protein